MENPAIEEKWINTGQGKIFYYQNRSFANRPTIILLHGLSSNHTTWLATMEELHKNQFNCLAPDLRGHGQSDKTKNRALYKIAVLSNDLNQIAKEEGVDKFYLVGYSFGGQVALDYVAKHPQSVKGLILISVNHANPLEYKGLKLLTPVFSGFINLLAFLFLWQKQKKYHYYQHGKAVGYWDSVWDGLRTMPISINFWMLADEFRIDFKSALSRIRIPTTIVYGKNDAFITKKEVKEMAEKILKSEVIFSKNPDHFIGTNAQKETLGIILDFLKKYENSDF